MDLAILDCPAAARLQLSSFWMWEERETGQTNAICAPTWRGAEKRAVRSLEREPTDNDRMWTNDAWLYRLDVRLARQQGQTR